MLGGKAHPIGRGAPDEMRAGNADLVEEPQQSDLERDFCCFAGGGNDLSPQWLDRALAV